MKTLKWIFISPIFIMFGILAFLTGIFDKSLRNFYIKHMKKALQGAFDELECELENLSQGEL